MYVGQREFVREKKHMYECEIQYYCVREREWIIVHERKGESTEQTLLFCNAEWLTTTEKKTALLFLIMSSEIMSYLFNHPPPPERGSDYKLINQLSSETKKVVSSHYL